MGKRVRIVLDEGAGVRRGGRVVVTADVLEIDVDLDELSQGPAEAIATVLGEDIAAIGAMPKASTLARRRREGITDVRMFNATGKLAHGITAVPGGDGYDVVAPADRLASDQQLDQLAELVPALDDPTDAPRVALALDRADDALLGTVTRKVR